MSERFNEDITRIKKPVFYKKTEVTYIAPLQPPALATFLSWGIQQELAV